MATLPDAFDLGQRPGLRTDRRIVSDQSGQIEGESLARFGDNVAQIAGRELEKVDRLNYAQARSAYLQADIAAREAADKDDDWENSPKSYESAMTKARESALSMVRNNQDRALLQQDLTVDTVQGVAAVRQIADRRRVDVENAGLETLLDNNMNTAIASDPVTMEKLLSESNEAIDGATSKGNVTNVWAGQRKRQLAETTAEKMVQLKTPDEQIAMLGGARPKSEGLIEAGNIDLTNRPSVKNPDGKISTVRSITVGIDGQSVLLPTVSDDGRLLSNDEAVDSFFKTGKHLGKFKDEASANAYAGQLHKDQDSFYTGPAKFIPPDRRAILLEQAQRDKAAQAKALQAAQVNDKVTSIMAIYAKDGQFAGTRAAGNLGDIPPELQDEVRSKVNEQLSQRRAQAQQENVDTIAGIKRAIAQDTADGNTETAIHELYRRGAYTPEQYSDQLAAYDRSRVDGAKENAAVAEVRQALVSGMPLDPQDPVVKKALVAAFKQDTLNMQPGSEDWINTASIYAARTRVLPQQASSWARKSMLSPDAAVAAPAAQFIASIHDTSPDAVQAFDEKTRAFASVASDMIGAGTSPEKAIESARRLAYETNEATDKRHTAEFNKLTSSASALNSLIDRDFDPGLFSSQPISTPQLQATFDGQARKYYRLNGGDIDSARELAWKDIKGVYGVSEVNGTKQMMLMPPERFGVDLSLVRKDVADFIAANPQPDGSTADEIMVVPDSLTQRTANTLISGGGSAQPSYQLMTKTGDVVTDARGNRKRYFLPSNEDLATNIRKNVEAAKVEAEKQVSKARSYRSIRDEVYRQSMENPER